MSREVFTLKARSGNLDQICSLLGTWHETELSFKTHTNWDKPTWLCPTDVLEAFEEE